MQIYWDDCVRDFPLILTHIPEGSDVAVHRYPLVFAMVALPLSVVRWSTGFGGAEWNVPAATFAVECIYSLSGALNVLLFLFARSPLLLPRNKAKAANRFGVAPTRTKSRFSEISCHDSAILDQRVPLGSVPGDDLVLNLPTLGHGSNESVL
jgi:hypothetical protein